jgi:SAM-dependent methyltransferase
MAGDPGLIPTQPTTGSEYRRWSAVFAGDGYYYGSDPGPLARRAVRYHRQYRPRDKTALDAGCGEGQDLAFLAEQGYCATGVEFTETGVAKAVRLLQSRGVTAEVVHQDLRTYEPPHRFELVLSVNTVPFLGADGPACLKRLVGAVAPGGVFAISAFARPCSAADAEQDGSPMDVVDCPFWLLTMDELMEYVHGWQMLEAARLWQWNPHTNRPQPFVTLIARNVPASPAPLPLP